MRRKVLVVILLMLFLCAVLYVFIRPDTSPFGEAVLGNVESYEFYQPTLTLTQDIAMIEGNADIKFPPSAHEIHDYTEGAREVYSEVRFDMGASELEEFLTGTLCDESLVQISPDSQKVRSNYPRAWFRPDEAKVLKQCSGEKDHSHQTILIDMTAPETYIVYVSDSVY